MKRSRCSSSRSRSSASLRRARPSTRAAPAFFSPPALKDSLRDDQISPRPVRRLTAYAEAGADCLSAPGLSTTQDVATVVKAVAPKPVNVLVSSDFTTVAELADLRCPPDQRGRRARARGMGQLSLMPPARSPSTEHSRGWVPAFRFPCSIGASPLAADFWLVVRWFVGAAFRRPCPGHVSQT